MLSSYWTPKFGSWRVEGHRKRVLCTCSVHERGPWLRYCVHICVQMFFVVYILSDLVSQKMCKSMLALRMEYPPLFIHQLLSASLSLSVSLSLSSPLYLLAIVLWYSLSISRSISIAIFVSILWISLSISIHIHNYLSLIKNMLYLSFFWSNLIWSLPMETNWIQSKLI